MSLAEQLVDIHCHLLPGIDDGAADWHESLAMARMAVADGIGTIVVTPHQLGSYASNTGEMIRRRTVELQQRLDESSIPLRVMPGADVRIEPDLPSQLAKGEVVSLADGKRYVLLELPHEMYQPLDRLLSELAKAGYSGILSHPERNRGIQADPSLVAALVQRDCLMQVTAGSLLGDFGRLAQSCCETWISQGLIHFLATDAHGTRARRPLLRPAFDRLAKLTDHETAIELCCRNPARVLLGKRIRALNTSSATPRLRGWGFWGAGR